MSQFFGSDGQNIAASASASVLISFEADWCDLLDVQGTLKSLLHHSSKASILQQLGHKEGCCAITQLCPTLCNPMDRSPPGSSVHGGSPGKKTGVGGHVLLQGNLPDPGIKPRSPELQVDSLLSAPPGKP